MITCKKRTEYILLPLSFCNEYTHKLFAYRVKWWLKWEKRTLYIHVVFSQAIRVSFSSFFCLNLPVSCADSLKTELERVEEEAMMEELIELVMMRDRLLWQLDDTKMR